MENNDYSSDLEIEKVNTRKLQAWAILFVSVLAIGLLSIYLYKTFIKDQANEVKKEPIVKTKIEKKRFIFEKKKENNPFKQLLEKTQNTPPSNNLPPLPQQIKKLIKPKIIKGSGVTLVTNNPLSATNVKTEEANTQNTLSLGAVPELLGSDKDYVGTTFTPTVANVSNFNPNLLLPKGTYIGCSLKIRLVSSIKGGISCTVSNDVYSSNGNVLLIEKGSTVTGMFKAEQLNDSINRLFIIWQEIRTPQNIVIPVFSGASDELGASGVEGWVDHHWMLRFGSAVLLSAVDDALNILASNITNQDNTGIDTTENTRENARSMSSIVLEQFINLKPTLYKNHGDIVGIYVNRDIDFSKVYKLSLKKPKVYK